MDGADGFLENAGRQLTDHSKHNFNGKDRLAAHVHQAWITFLIVFVGLAIFDMKYLAPRAKSKNEGEPMSGKVAGYHVLFWFCVGLLFNVGMWAFLGQDVAIVWFNGYLLEYLLSMDNVFFFHVVFTAYATPPKDLYKGLFLGILGAVVLRLLFYIVGAKFFRAAFIVQVGFGLILVWSGYKTATSDDDDEDPRENQCVQLMTRWLPLTGTYDSHGLLFVRVPKEQTGPMATVVGAPDASGGTVDPEQPATEKSAATGDAASSGGPLVWKGTMLLLVVLVLQVIDLIFAVDSVTAKIAEYDSTFINFTSSAFAMLCLRSLYFVFTKLLKYFHYLKYGVAAILVMIGVKLMISPLVDIPGELSLLVICIFFGVSILMSALRPPDEEYNEMTDDKPAVKEDATPYPKSTGGSLDFEAEAAPEDGSDTVRRDTEVSLS